MKIINEHNNNYVYESLTAIKRDADPTIINKFSASFRDFTGFMVLYLINYKNINITKAADFVYWYEHEIKLLYIKNKSVKYIIDNLYKK